MNTPTLYDVPPGSLATVRGLTAQGNMRRRLLDIGLIEGTTVICLGISPLGDPRAFSIRGATIALRKKDCQTVLIKGIRRVKE